NRSLRAADDYVPAALLPCDSASRASTVGIVRGDDKSDRGVDFAPNHRGVPLGWCTWLSYSGPGARSSGRVCAPWAFGTSRSLPDRRGRIRSDEALILSHHANPSGWIFGNDNARLAADHVQIAIQASATIAAASATANQM